MGKKHIIMHSERTCYNETDNNKYINFGAAKFQLKEDLLSRLNSKLVINAI